MAKVSRTVDDIAFARGELVEATHHRVLLAFDGRTQKFDLGDENYDALRAVMNPWFDAVEEEQSPVVAVPSKGQAAIERAQVRFEEGPQENPDHQYGLFNRSGRWVVYPGIGPFAKTVGVKFHPANIPEVLAEMYRDARDSGEFVPDGREYPLASAKNRELLSGR